MNSKRESTLPCADCDEPLLNGPRVPIGYRKFVCRLCWDQRTMLAQLVRNDDTEREEDLARIHSTAKSNLRETDFVSPNDYAEYQKKMKARNQ